MTDDLDRELRTHLELEAEEQRDAGLSAEAARDAAMRALGNQTRIREEVRALSPLAGLLRRGHGRQSTLKWVDRLP